MPNKLSTETSPYLLQHAENPVDWFPWGKEALEKSRDEDKPILLSIGYSACHWCHVMERESFEDPDTADLMNAGFVNIKVDREERPDLDSIYMKAVQATMGRGGWPLTAFLTPDGRYFYGGTYFPPTPTHGMPSFRQVLTSVLDAYENRREQIEEGSNQVLRILESTHALGGKRAQAGAVSGEAPDGESVDLTEFARSTAESAFQGLAGQHDPVHGGFGSAPKFPQPATLEFLLRYFHQTGQREALEMVLLTLRAMARGGIRDHLGGGFHRYSVDARWLVPHFEKMLYDNGLLASLYLQAYQATGNPELRDTVSSTLDYLLEDLRDSGGGFYSARDADSEGEEGTFYLWNPEELEEVLGTETAALFGRVYAVTPGGNFEGKTILNLPRGLDALAESQGMSPSELTARMEMARNALKEARATREHPFRDEKVLTSWNSFVLRALAEAGGALGRADYVDAARENADFILRELFRDGRVLRSWKDGDSRIPGFLEDYAGLGNALLTLYETTLERRWVEEAEGIGRLILELFWDAGESIFYDSPVDGEQLVVRAREIMDNATPSGNSLAVEFFLRLSSFFGSDSYRLVAQRVLIREAGHVSQFPTAFGRLLSTLTLASATPTEVVLLGDSESPEFRDLLATAHRGFIPNRVVAGGSPGSLPPLPLLKGRELVGGRATAFVCRDFTCSRPLHEPEELSRELDDAPGNWSGL